MYALKIEDVKSRAKVRNYSGLFSMGALAVALSACGGEFKLKEEGGVTINKDGNLVLEFDADVKDVDGTKVKVGGVALTKDDVTKGTSSATIKLATGSLKLTGNNLEIKIDADGIKGDSKDYTFDGIVDNKAPEAKEGATVTGNVVTITFDEDISSAVAGKFKIGTVEATGAAVNPANKAQVLVTFKDAPSGKVTIEAGAVTDDPANKLNQVGNSNADDEAAIGSSSGGGDTTPPELVDGDAGESGTQSLTIDTDKKVLTVHFDEAIIAKVDEKITVSGTDATSTVAVSGSTLTITFTNALVAGNYQVSIAEGGVSSAGGATTAILDTSSLTVDASLDDGLVGVGGLSSDSDYGF